MKDKSRKATSNLIRGLWIFFGIYVAITIGVVIALIAFESPNWWIVALVMGGMAAMMAISLFRFSESLDNLVDGMEETPPEDDTTDDIN